jgi:hypothetical protein
MNRRNICLGVAGLSFGACNRNAPASDHKVNSERDSVTMVNLEITSVTQGEKRTVFIGVTGKDSYAIAIDVGAKRQITVDWDGSIKFESGAKPEVAAKIFYESLVQLMRENKTLFPSPPAASHCSGEESVPKPGDR